MELNLQDHQKNVLSVNEYASELEKSGIRVIPGSVDTFWIRYEMGVMMRIPTFALTIPDRREIMRILWRAPALSISYIQEPDEYHAANSWLYISTDNTYTLKKLSSTMRRNVQRGLKELRIAPLGTRELLESGVQAFCDTRQRVGLNDGTPKQFRHRFFLRSKCRGHVYIGAWKDETLAAFLSITEVDNWAEIEGCFSMNDYLNYRPNDSLMFSALQYYLREKGFSIVSYGLSSLQAESNKAGLHAFKKKVGFEAKPVHRVFVPHPLIRPFVNQLTLSSVKTVLRFVPRNRLLKKTDGMLRLILDKL